MIDPITLQVLRHRLQAINDEQIQVTVRTSGSPTVYEAFDVNSSLLTPAGESLCIGHYVLVLSMSFDTTVRYIMERFSENPGIHEGDVFYTNDPWAGAGHQNDTVMVAPMFWDGEIVAWSGLSLHEMDVGGPLAGGYGALAKDIYGEAPLIPPVKIVERGVVRVDIEDAVLRNSRTPAFNALDMRGRLAAINRGRTRINEIIQRYGKEGFLEAQQAILDVAQQAFARRLRELPDGTWTQEGYLDYGRLYRLRLVATKAEDRLTLDFRDASKQAPAMVNSARCLTEGGIMASVLAQVCYDMPWAPAGFKRNLDVLTTPGTLVDAVHPAGVGQGGTASASLALNLVSTALCKMFAASDKHRDEAQADWVPSTKRPVVAGLNRQGRPFAITLIDQAGGGGALSFRDGQDSVHRPGSPMMAMGNVEVYERLYPVLYLYRKHSIDTAGPGKFRGGRGTQVAITPHRNPKPIQLLNLAGCTAHTEARGLYGGYPAPAQPTFLLRGAHPLEDVASGSMPGDLADFHSRDRRTLKSREVVRVYRGDVYVSVQAGGAGYGDPLEREFRQCSEGRRARGVLCGDGARGLRRGARSGGNDRPRRQDRRPAPAAAKPALGSFRSWQRSIDAWGRRARASGGGGRRHYERRVGAGLVVPTLRPPAGAGGPRLPPPRQRADRWHRRVLPLEPLRLGGLVRAAAVRLSRLRRPPRRSVPPKRRPHSLRRHQRSRRRLSPVGEGGLRRRTPLSRLARPDVHPNLPRLSWGTRRPLIVCVARSSRISGVFRHGGRHQGVTSRHGAVSEL